MYKQNQSHEGEKKTNTYRDYVAQLLVTYYKDTNIILILILMIY